MTIASLGLHAPPREPRRFPNRKPPTLDDEAREAIAQTARILEARVLQLRDALVEQAKRGKSPKVQTYIDLQGWPNEAAIRARFRERYGHAPKTYAKAFGACSACRCVAINATCAACAERERIQKGPR